MIKSHGLGPFRNDGAQDQMSRKRYLYTSEIAKAVGVHPNTVRLYEEWGFLPSIPRSFSGYRLFTEAHLDQMRLARTALQGPWPGQKIKRSALALVRQAAAGDLGGALERSYHHLALVQAEQAQAEAAAELLKRWAEGTAADATIKPLRIGQAAKLLDVSTDMLRNWERDNLIQVPRNPRNGYRLYGATEIGRLRVIRMLRRAGYSTMAILRMVRQLDHGRTKDLRQVLDTPSPDEKVADEPGSFVYAADHWLSTLAALEQRAVDLISQLEGMIAKQKT
jgi:DNA-binding transcriptional MerR regulator